MPKKGLLTQNQVVDTHLRHVVNAIFAIVGMVVSFTDFDQLYAVGATANGENEQWLDLQIESLRDLCFVESSDADAV